MQEVKPTKLRLGVMCMGGEMPRWEKECIDHLLATGMVELALIILDDPQNYPQRSFVKKVMSIAVSKWFFQGYLRTMYKPASEQVLPAADWYDAAPKISCVVEKKGKFSQYFKKEDIETIKGYNLDFVLRFGFNIIRGEILKVPKYGVWSFHHDDEMVYRGGPSGFWEIYKKDPETGSILQRITDKLDGGIILKKGIFRTKSYAYSKNIDQSYFESAKWPAWVCKDIIAGNADYLDDAPTTTTAPIYKHPANGAFLKWSGIIGANILKKAWDRLFVWQHWNVIFLKTNINEFIKNPTTENGVVLPLKNKKSFNADCFGVKDEDRYYVFIEELDYSASGRGVIKGFILDEAGNILEEFYPEGFPDVHLSYPTIQKINGKYYIIPESGENGKIELYEAVDFPKQWKSAAVLMEGAMYSDATLLERDGKFWLFYTEHGDDFDGDLHLHIAYADRLEGPYTEHTGNPVKISARAARPAGNFFSDDKGRLIRPAQNFTKTYGGSIVLNEVKVLTENRYEEVELTEIKSPHPVYKDGMHTISAVGDDAILVDVKVHRFKYM
jgi:hypothetical protein